MRRVLLGKSVFEGVFERASFRGVRVVFFTECMRGAFGEGVCGALGNRCLWDGSRIRMASRGVHQIICQAVGLTAHSSDSPMV